MSIIHLNQIKAHILSTYKNHLEMRDVRGSSENIENQALSRGLSAFTIESMCDCGLQKAATAVTDSANDNGIDAIYVDPSNNIIHVVQSKWIHSGKGEPSNGDIKKYISGIKDLLNCNFSRFNDKIREKEAELIKAMSMPNGKLIGHITYTGINQLAEPSQRDIKDFLDEVNDVSSYLSFRVINQKEIYKLLTRTIGGDPIDLEVGLKNWGNLKEPSLAYYGQVNGEELKSWWEKHGSSLLTRNIRNSLGDTEINQEINETLLSSPEKFWYFNNGITLISKKIAKTLVGGGDRDYGTFHCEDVSVVNGAQTLSTIGKADQSLIPTLSQVFVPVRLISLENDDEMFGEQITKANNLQNRIESRDFASLDPEQQRLKLELSIEDIDYSIKRDSAFSAGPKSFDLMESTSALACASSDINLIVQLKREVGKIWDDIKRPPYTTIFNPGLTSTYLYRCVKVNREIDKQISETLKELSVNSSSYGVGIHGNRLIAGLAFQEIDQKILSDPKRKIEEVLNEGHIKKITNEHFFTVSQTIEDRYKNAVLPTLFKNKNKCREIFLTCSGQEIDNNNLDKSSKQLDLI